MGMPTLEIKLLNGNVGQIPKNDDGVVGIIVSGVGTAQIPVDTPKQFFTLADIVAAGITPAYDTTNTCDVYQQLSDLYKFGNVECWLMITAKTVTMTDWLDKTKSYAPALLNAAAGRIKVLGVSRTPSAAVTNTGELDADVALALVKGQELAADRLAKYEPIVVIIAGRNFSGTTATLTDLKQGSNRNCAIVVAGIGSGLKQAAVGLVLGRIATIPVQRNIGRVADGDLLLSAGYLSDGTSVETSASKLDAIHDKGYIVLRRYAGLSGYYFADDPTCTSAADDYNSIARNRVINKAVRICYDVFIRYINDEVRINADGTIESTYAKGMQSAIENRLNLQMTAEGEISSASCFIDVNQNVLSTNKINIAVSIVPVGYVKSITVNLGFVNPAI